MNPSKEDYENFFNNADSDKSGVLTKDELSNVLREQRYSESQIDGYFAVCDLSNDQKITLEEFLIAMDAVPEVDHKKASLKRTFNGFDKDGSGKISANELREVLGGCTSDLTEAQMQRIADGIDEDGDGMVNYEEFCEHFFS